MCAHRKTRSSEPSRTRPLRLRLRSRVWALVLCALAGPLLGNGGPDLSADQLVQAVQERYDGIKDITARFEQASQVASIGRTEQSRGSVTIKRPGRMRWEYSGPEPRVIALDGTVLRMYLPEDEQLQIAPLGAGTFPPTALDFLLGEGKLETSFTAERIPEERSGELGLLLRPKQDASFERLEIWVSAEGQQLRESVVVDLFGNRTAVRFGAIRENAGVSDEIFRVEVPEGTDVIDLRTEP